MVRIRTDLGRCRGVKLVRDRAEARWLPSRFNFAIFRLLAYARLQTSKTHPRPGLMLAVERHQSAAENYIVCIAMIVLVTFYFAAIFDAVMPPLPSFVIAVPAALFAIQVHITVSGLVMRLFRKGHAVVADSVLFMITAIIAACYFAVGDSSALWAARAFLLVVALNAIAAVVMFALRHRIADAERRFGAGD